MNCSWTDFEYGWNQRLSTADFRAKLDSEVHNKLSSITIITQIKHLMQIDLRPLKYPTVQVPFAAALPLTLTPLHSAAVRVKCFFYLKYVYLPCWSPTLLRISFFLGVCGLNLRDIAKFASCGCCPVARHSSAGPVSICHRYRRHLPSLGAVPAPLHVCSCFVGARWWWEPGQLQKQHLGITGGLQFAHSQPMKLAKHRLEGS